MGIALEIAIQRTEASSWKMGCPEVGIRWEFDSVLVIPAFFHTYS